MIRLLQILLAFALLASPLMAQTDTPDSTRHAELQRWFNSLSPREQTKLRKRLRVINRLPKEQQKEMLKSAKEGKPALSRQQVQNLKKLGKMSYLKRVRLQILMRELEMAKKTNKAGFDSAMSKVGAERKTALLQLVRGQRTRMFMRSMPETRRRELENLTPVQRKRKMHEWFKADSKARLNKLSARHPRIKDLRVAAEKGDKQAKKELREVIADLATLDRMISKLTPERRRKVLAEIKDMDTDKAANRVRRAMNDQFKKMRNNRSHKEKRRPKDDRKRTANPQDSKNSRHSKRPARRR
ncbi:MAG: hypothetical protein L3J82_06295 [Planctomycetes bacterium]|nr:hypothetical protein [Planctomycetota bacterium]